AARPARLASRLRLHGPPRRLRHEPSGDARAGGPPAPQRGPRRDLVGRAGEGGAPAQPQRPARAQRLRLPALRGPLRRPPGGAGADRAGTRVVGYYGAIAEWFDSDLVADLAERRPDWRFILVGSTFTADLRRLARLENVDLVGEVPYGQVPRWLSLFDVTILPFRRNALTEATNPVKAYEILAAGKPLVSVPLPEMVRLAPLIRLASSAGEFEKEIAEELRARDSGRDRERRA